VELRYNNNKNNNLLPELVCNFRDQLQNFLEAKLYYGIPLLTATSVFIPGKDTNILLTDIKKNKLASYGTDGRLFASDVCVKFKVT